MEVMRLKVEPSSIFLLLISLVLLIIQMIGLSTCSPTIFQNTSFSFDPSFDSNTREIVLEGHAFISGGALQPTKNQLDGRIDYSVGRATYAHPVRLWDRASGNIADFATNFSFEISITNGTRRADGIAFFLAPKGSSLPPDSYGSNLGLHSWSSATDRSSFVAVEFDTNYNHRMKDPADNHVGIDVNSLVSAATAHWIYNETAGGKLDAWISYDSGSMNLTVRLLNPDDGTSALGSNLSLNIDLRKQLPEWVVVGFSGATGRLVEINKIFSWHFWSCLGVINETPSSQSMKRLWLLLGICGSGAFACMGFILLLSCKRRNNNSNKRKLQRGVDRLMFLDEEGIEVVVAPRVFSYKTLMEATNNFSEQSLLGEGGFGRVYSGFLKELNRDVAVKKITQQSHQGIKEYLAEVRIISRLRHRNLVQLLGWCNEQHQLLLVYELMSNNSLDFHLFHESSSSSLTWPIRYKIALDVASALFYLQQECDHCVLHRDIKVNNILLTLTFDAKLGDFGLAKLVEHGALMRTTDILFGTEGYVAPEYMESRKASKESDIYSFGIVLLQLASGQRAIQQVNGIKIQLVERFWSVYDQGGDILGAADPRLHGNYDKEQMKRLMIVGLTCAHPNYLERPTIMKVINMLTSDAPLPVQMLNVNGGHDQVMNGYAKNSICDEISPFIAKI